MDILKKRGILLWDIDGTILTRKARSKVSIHLRTLGLKDTHIEKTELDGLTDWELLFNYSRFLNSNPGDLQKQFNKLGELQKKEPRGEFKIMAGATPDLFSKLAQTWDLGILTGNTFNRAIHKLEDVELIKYFDQRYFFTCELGDDRNAIALRAKKLLERIHQNIILIGDTPSDIRAARNSNFKIVSVATGKYNMEELTKNSPDKVLKDLKINYETLDSIFLKLINDYSA